jgi:hypothetical protein
MGTVSRKRSWVFWVLLTVPVIAVLLIVGYFFYWNQLVSRGAPVNEQVQTFNETDFLLVLSRPSMDIPVHNVFVPKEASVFVDIYPYKRIKVESVKLSGNSSSSLNFDSKLDQFSSDGNLINNSQSVGQVQDSESGIYYRTAVQAYHPLEVRKANQTHVLTIVYRTWDNQTSEFSQPLVIKDDFLWRIETWDLGNFNYFWFIFAGVLLSRVFPLPNQQSGNSDESKMSERIKLRPLELVWVPFSAIITLLIFSSFKGQVQPTTDIIGNIALAFGFGIGFDKVLTMGQKV